MKNLNMFLTLGLAAGFAGGASAAILQTDAGGTVGGGNSITLIDGDSDTADWIDDFGDADDSGTLYYGFDYTVASFGGATGGDLWGGLQLYLNDSERLAVGSRSGSTDISTFGFSSSNTGEEIALGQTYRLVVQIDFVNGGNDSATVWIDPTNSGSASTDLGSGNAGFNEIQIRGAGSVTYGNIIFATTFDEAAAVPEPGSLALIGLGGLCLLRRRRR